MAESRRAEAPAGIRSQAANGRQIVIDDGNIVAESADLVNTSDSRKSNKYRRATTPAVAFALSLAAPLDEPPMADGKRFRFLFSMREQLPAWLWSEVRASVNIQRNGLTNLSPTEARQFVNAFGQNLGGAQ